MRDSTSLISRAAGDSAASSLDLVCCSVVESQLAVLVQLADRGSAKFLPWESLAPTSPLDTSAARFAREQLGRSPAWISQVGAFGGRSGHPSGSPLSLCYVAVVPTDTEAPEGMSWVAVDPLPRLPRRQQGMVASAALALRDRMDVAPIAFRMLPPEFTLSELQEMYEILLGRRLHKASFRRALQGAYLVEPAGSWRSEGRGRPAQLFRYAPRKRRGQRRPVRFELLG